MRDGTCGINLGTQNIGAGMEITMKEKYIEPVIEIVKFETEDIIVTSLTSCEFPGDDDGWGPVN